MLNPLYGQVVDWSNLLLAYRKAAKGKRAKQAAASFEHQLADRLLLLEEELSNFTYLPCDYHSFTIYDPKERFISAAEFRDRVVHHALCNIIEPVFEKGFISDSYANRIGKGTHLAVDRLQQLSRQYRYVLRSDIIQHFPSIDHEILFRIISQSIHDEQVLWLVDRIIKSGVGLLDEEYDMVFFSNDNLLAICRPRGLPIGNLTSQFWSNVYLTPLDLFVRDKLGCRDYLRYVDDFALFSNSKRQLYAWKREIIEFLGSLRLTIHEPQSQVIPCTHGIPWLGFVVYPGYRRVKSRNVVKFSRRLRERWNEYARGEISSDEFHSSVRGWINHVRYADSWGLRRHVLGRPLRFNAE